jgi:hypothetical protein
MSSCSGEPISWLRLERYQLGELGEVDRASVAQHLAGCESCSTCLEHTRGAVELLALPRAARRSRGSWNARTRWHWIASLATAAAALAGTLLMLRPGDVARAPAYPSRVHIKGGELALSLVREHHGTIANDSSRFAAGDRWKLLLTCPPEMRLYVDLVVLQGEGMFFPLPPTRIDHCGNRIALPGAFTLDGSANASVCVMVSETAPPDRAAVQHARVRALPPLSVCQPLVRSAAERAEPSGQ